MPSQPAPSRSPPIGAIALVLLACPLYALMLAAILSMPGGDPASYGAEGSLAATLSQLYALVSGLLLWIALGILLWTGWKNGGMPRRAGIAAGILHPLSCIAAAVAAGVAYSYPGGWSIVVPEALPPLLALYAMWARLPALHTVLRPDITSGAVLGAIAVVIGATPPLWYLDDLQFPARLARERAESEVMIAQREAEWANRKEEQKARFHGLTANSSLADYLDEAPAGIDREQVVTGVRQVKSRQIDAVTLLKEGKIRRLEELWRFDLAATPALCEAFGAALRQVAIEDDLDWSVAVRLEDQLSNMKWLVAEHCNLDDGVSAAEKRVVRRIVAVAQSVDLPRWQQVLADLDELHRKR